MATLESRNTAMHAGKVEAEVVKLTVIEVSCQCMTALQISDVTEL